jgi:hypothetical protein
MQIDQREEWVRAPKMTRAHEKVRNTPKGKYKELIKSRADRIEQALKISEDRWKVVILFHPVQQGATVFFYRHIPFWVRPEVVRSLSGLS